jgi:hypothetical protein
MFIKYFRGSRYAIGSGGTMSRRTIIALKRKDSEHRKAPEGPYGNMDASSSSCGTTARIGPWPTLTGFHDG